MRRRVLVLVLVLALAACGTKDKPSASAAAGSGSAKAQPAPPVSSDVKVLVDDAQVGSVTEQQVGLWPRIDTLVPVPARRLGTWQSIKLQGAQAKAVEIATPSSSYPELVPALFPGEGGKPAFGMFDPVELAKHGQPVLRENYVSEVRVTLSKNSGRGENEHGEGGGTDPAELKITVKTKAGESVIEGAKLLAIPREPPPGSDGEGAKGWKLSVVLAQAGIKKYERLLLADAKGTNLTLEKQDLDEKTAVPFVKLNRQGTLRFRVFRKQGTTWQPGSDLRGLTTIEVLK